MSATRPCSKMMFYIYKMMFYIYTDGTHTQCDIHTTTGNTHLILDRFQLAQYILMIPFQWVANG